MYVYLALTMSALLTQVLEGVNLLDLELDFMSNHIGTGASLLLVRLEFEIKLEPLLLSCPAATATAELFVSRHRRCRETKEL